jgi:sulfite reductase alpha subunit-like flavoprotein
VQPTTSSTSVHCVLVDKYLDLAGLFRAFPGHAARLDLAKLLQLLPKNRPRFYSISSSPLISPSTAAISVGMVLEKTSQGTIRRGLCSNLLCAAQKGQAILASVRQSSFRLPADSTVPILCVGPGTGLAPFVGFMDERIVTYRASVRIGRTVVFTGAPTEGDLIYGERIEQWRSACSSVEIHVALSRAGEKQRVQDLMRKRARDVVRLLLDEGAWLYVCGDAGMADGTSETLMDLIVEERSLSRMAAKELIMGLRDDGRYQSDVWGTTRFFSEGMVWFENKIASPRNHIRDRAPHSPRSPMYKW